MGHWVDYGGDAGPLGNGQVWVEDYGPAVTAADGQTYNLNRVYSGIGGNNQDTKYGVTGASLVAAGGDLNKALALGGEVSYEPYRAGDRFTAADILQPLSLFAAPFLAPVAGAIFDALPAGAQAGLTAVKDAIVSALPSTAPDAALGLPDAFYSGAGGAVPRLPTFSDAQLADGSIAGGGGFDAATAGANISFTPASLADGTIAGGSDANLPLMPGASNTFSFTPSMLSDGTIAGDLSGVGAAPLNPAGTVSIAGALKGAASAASTAGTAATVASALKTTGAALGVAGAAVGLKNALATGNALTSSQAGDGSLSGGNFSSLGASSTPTSSSSPTKTQMAIALALVAGVVVLAFHGKRKKHHG